MRTRITRTLMAVAMASASLTLVAASDASVGAVWDCDGNVTVTADVHAISNIVIDYAEADDVKIEEPFEQVDEEENPIEVFEYVLAYEEGMVGVWIKAGNNRSDGGPGYGEYVELEEPDCGPDLGTGPIQATLTWTNADGNVDDWDLYIIAPDGEFTAYYNPVSASGGTLDFDSTCGAGAGDKVENIFFDDPAPGEYTVGVDLYSSCFDGLPNAEFTLSVKVDGVEIYSFSNDGDTDPAIRIGGPENEFTFVYGA